MIRGDLQVLPGTHLSSEPTVFTTTTNKQEATSEKKVRMPYFHGTVRKPVRPVFVTTGPVRAVTNNTHRASTSRAVVVTATRQRTPAPYAMHAGVSSREVKAWDFLLPAITPMVTVDAVVGGATFATGMSCINLPINDATFFGRVGSKIVIKSVAIKACFYTTTAATDVGLMRWMLVYDRQPNGAYPAIGDILRSNATAPAGSGAIHDGLNMQNRSRFSVIRDKIMSLDPGSAPVRIVNEFCKGRWEVEYKGSAGGVADITTGAMILCFWYDMCAHVPACASMSTRIRYDD